MHRAELSRREGREVHGAQWPIASCIPGNAWFLGHWLIIMHIQSEDIGVFVPCLGLPLSFGMLFERVSRGCWGQSLED